VFYRALFGWGQDGAMGLGWAGVYQMFGRAGGKAPIGGMYNASQGQPAQWLPYARVASADQAGSIVAQAGGRVAAGPMDVPNGRVTICVDPQGAGFAVHAIAAAASAKPARKPAAAKKRATPAKSKIRPKAKAKSKKKGRKR